MSKKTYELIRVASGVFRYKDTDGELLLSCVAASPKCGCGAVAIEPCSVCGNDWEKLPEATRRGVLEKIGMFSEIDELALHRYCRSCGKVVLQDTTSSFCSAECRQREGRIRRGFVREGEKAVADGKIKVTHPHSYYAVSADPERGKATVEWRGRTIPFVVKMPKDNKTFAKEMAKASSKGYLHTAVCTPSKKPAIVYTKEAGEAVEKAMCYLLSVLENIPAKDRL